MAPFALSYFVVNSNTLLDRRGLRGTGPRWKRYSVAGKPIPVNSWLHGEESLGSYDGRRLWRSRARKQFYTWDSLHGEVEVWDFRG